MRRPLFIIWGVFMFFRPHLKKEHITDITIDDLKALGVDTLILDVDNTLSKHHSQTAAPGVIDWIADMQREGIKLIILSNARRARVEPFANMLGLDFLPLGLKPLTGGYRKIRKRIGLKKEQIATVCDQLFTDMLGGNLAGIKCILVTPYEEEDKPSFRIRRKLEKVMLKRYGY